MTRRWPTWKQKQAIFRALGYEPHERQVPAHRSEARVVLACGAERAGKSQWTGLEILARLLWCKRVAIAAQEYDECRAEMGYVIQGLETLGGIERASTPQTGKWTVVTRGGIEVETVSLHDGPLELTGRGRAYDIVALVEAGRIRYDSFLAARGRVAEPRGVILLSGTLWDNFGWYADLYKSFEGPNVFEGERFSFPAWVNRAVYPGGRDDAEIKRLESVLPSDEFARRVAAELVPSPARIFPEFEFALHVGKVGFDPSLPVELAVDAGYYPSHYAVLALQVAEESFNLAGGGVVRLEVVRVIDEIWEHHLMHHDVVAACRLRPWWRSVTRAVGGHETKQHQAAESTAEVWESLVGQEPGDPSRFRFDTFDAGRILDGVTRVKTFLKDPALRMRRLMVGIGCTGIQHEFQAYKRRTDQQGNVLSEEPEDKNNDALDALRNWLVERYGLVEQRSREPTPGRRYDAGLG